MAKRVSGIVRHGGFKSHSLKSGKTIRLKRSSQFYRFVIYPKGWNKTSRSR